jgi:pimeloyl-ACP methyl ester carboxylesterase
MAALTPGRSPVVGGLSLGALSALAVVNQNPEAYSGLLAWEGSLVTDDPSIRAHNLTFCNQFAQLVSVGVPLDDQSLPFVKMVTQLARSAPNDPFLIPVPGFPSGLTNRQAFIFILSTPNPVTPSPRPAFITAAGDVASNTLHYSSEARLSANIALFNDVTANRVSRDFYCSLAGVETAYSANLRNFKAPVLIIKAGRGFGPIMDELPAKLGSKSVAMYPINAFAHVDHLGSPLHWVLLEFPIAHWLGGVLPY